jgi:hypothetical protein
LSSSSPDNGTQDTRRLYALIEADTSRTQTLKSLLFSEAAIYNGQTLFEQFGDDEQRQTNHLLEDSKSVLQSAYQLLERRYGLRTSSAALAVGQAPLSVTSNLSTSSTMAPSTNLVRKPSDKSMKSLILWSLRDKKKVEAILQKFTEQNSRIQDNVKLWCLANQLGVNLPHLKRMQQDDSSKKLGFDIDAALKLAQRDAQANTCSLELTGPEWDLSAINPTPHQGVFKPFEKDGTVYIQENHAYELPAWPSASQSGLELGTFDLRTRNRVESLAKLLHQPKEHVFRIPKCIGWKYLPQSSAVAFVFESASQTDNRPISLLQLLFGEAKLDTKPGLGHKFRLALGLATCVAQLHMVGWLHESFRSSNILFFPPATPLLPTTKARSASPSRSSVSIDFSEPWVLGFEFSRLDIGRTVGYADFDPERDIYRHPQRQGDPEVHFTRIHDIYALGVVLLEIGLWEPAIKLEKNMFAHANKGENVQRQLLKHASHRLESRVGAKYRDAVIKCLTGEFGVVDDNKEDLKLQQAFRSQVVDVLERAANSV